MAFAARQLLLLKLQDEGRQKASRPVPVCFPAGFGTTRRVAHVDIRMLQYSTCRDQMEGTAKERGCQGTLPIATTYLLQNPTYCRTLPIATTLPIAATLQPASSASPGEGKAQKALPTRVRSTQCTPSFRLL